jgi:hypothetical protein
MEVLRNNLKRSVTPAPARCLPGLQQQLALCRRSRAAAAKAAWHPWRQQPGLFSDGLSHHCAFTALHGRFSSLVTGFVVL